MTTESKKTAVYLMPGMAANPDIFEHIELPEEDFILRYLDWKKPFKGESLKAYSKRIAEDVKEPNPVLIGVSFGGVIVQEISKLIRVKRVVIISSVKTHSELPSRLKFLATTGLDKVLPTFLAPYAVNLRNLPLGRHIEKRLELYDKYMTHTGKHYLDWSIHALINWSQKSPLKNVVHIHGDRDKVLPIDNIETCIRVKGGTHVMIVNRFRWFNENLPSIIQEKNAN